MKLLHSSFRRHFAGKPVVASRNVGCFHKLWRNLGTRSPRWPYHLPYYRNVMLGWEELPNKDFPIIFHPVYGKDEREGSSPSFFNVAEVETIERYLRKLLDENVRSRGLKHLRPEMIGIISPYKRQVRASVKFEVKSTNEAKLEPVISRKLSNIWQVFYYEVSI